MTRLTSTGRTRHSARLWGQARNDYLAGDSGPAICARYGLKLGTLRARAKLDGWRRLDHPRDLLSLERSDPDAQLHKRRFEAGGLFDLACKRLDRAVRADRLRDAQAWSRLARDLLILSDLQDSVRETGERLLQDCAQRLPKQDVGNPSSTSPHRPVQTVQTPPASLKPDSSDAADGFASELDSNPVTPAETGRSPTPAPAGPLAHPAPPGSPPAAADRAGPPATADPGSAARPSPSGPRLRSL